MMMVMASDWAGGERFGGFMSEIRIMSFAFLEEPAEEFLALPQKVEGLSDDRARAEKAGTKSLLDPSNSFYENGESRSFVALRSGAAVGRICAFHNRALVKAHGPYGLVGLFACSQDQEAARELIDAASDWLKTHDLKVIRGPMAGDIWHRWRFMTKGFETEPFPGEPRQPSYYPELFTACGFASVRTYSTKKITDLPAQLARFKVAVNLNRKRGYTFRNFDRDRWEEDVKSLHELCAHSFATNWSVTPVAFGEFAEIYNRWLKRVGPDHILLAQSPDGEVVGLGLAVVAPSDTMNLRTLAVLPGHHGYGLGQAIAAEIYQRAIADGQKFVHHCQMSPVTPPQRWDGGRAQVTREYSMFERGIG